jgi:hypothetical protein
LYFNEIYNHVTDIKKNKIFFNIKKLNSLNEEMKMRVFKKSIVYLTNTYYSPRAKKIFNLISLIKVKKNVKFTLGGCIILKEKTRLCLKKESEN